MDNGRSGLVVLLLRDPHLLEGGEGGQDGSSDPDGVLPFWRSNNLNLHCAGGQGGDLLLHPVGDTGVHGGSSGQDSVGVQVLTDINIALHDGVVGGLVDTTGLHTKEGRLEKSLRASEPFITDCDNLTVGKLIGLLERRAASSGGHLLLEVQGDVAKLLLDVPDDFSLGGGGERVSSLGQDLHEVICQVTSSQVKTENSVRQSIS